MSQRIHSCVNNTNLDTIQCDAYSTRLIHKEKSRLPMKTGHARPPQVAPNKVILPATKHPLKRPQDSYTCKELYADKDAMVEVTVKTHKTKDRARSTSSSHSSTGEVWGVGNKEASGTGNKECWGKVLKSQNSHENLSSFTHFDPLRTIHFLAQELQSKLQQSLPEDLGIRSMVNEMNQALSRVPPDVPSANDRVHGKERYDMMPTKLQTNHFKENNNPRKYYLKDTMSQTPQSLYVEPEKLQQHLEESSEKIEKACKQMESLCSKLKTEKEELQTLLRTEKDNVKVLSKQLDEQKVKFTTSEALIESIQARNDQLETEMRKLQVQLQSQNGPSAQELRSFIQELQKQKTDAEGECMTLKQQLTLASMEAEKYETILQARDLQVKEIRNEMTQLQEVVNEQLLELQNHPYSSDASSLSNMTGTDPRSFANVLLRNHFLQAQTAGTRCEKVEDSGKGSITSEDANRENFMLKDNTNPRMNKVVINRNKFKEIKDQALNYNEK